MLGSQDKLRRGLAVGALVLATLLAYEGLRRNGFTDADDPHYVTRNARVLRGLTLDGVRWAFTTFRAANWHPLTWLSHMLDVELFDLDPAGHHASSLVLHVANAVLLLFLLARWTNAFGRSFVAAGLFALHPLRVESVAWAAERKDVLSTFFLMLTLWAYTSYVRKPGAVRMAWVALLYAAGLMAKPMLVTLPFALLLLDFWPLERLRDGAIDRRARTRTLVLEKLPLLALALASCIATYVAQHSAGAVQSVERLPILMRVSNALVSYGRYLVLTGWPAELAVYYPYPRAAPIVGAIGNLVLLGGLSWIVLRERTRRPYLLTGWLWYLGTLVPVIGFLQVGSQALADRYSYIPAIGLALAAVWTVADLLKRTGTPAAIGALLTAPILIALALVTHRQVGYWKDSCTLFGRAVAVTEENSFAHQCLGNGLIEVGRLDEAIVHLKEALRITPNFAHAHNGLGGALFAQGKLDEAIPCFHEAMRIAPRFFEPRFNLGLVLSAQGKLEEAIAAWEEAVAIDPEHFDAQVHLARTLGGKGRLQESLLHFQSALELRPADIETRRWIAITHTLLGDVEAAIGEYEQLLRSHPDDLDALNNIAWIRATHAEAKHRDGAQAVLLAERARDRSTEPNAVLFDTLAAAYAEAGRFADALRACERAIELAQAGRQESDLQRFREHLALFQAGQPFHAR